MKKILLLVGLAALLLPGMAFSLPVSRSVGPGQDYTTIQSAIDVSNTGDHVVVWPGTYHELINFLGKEITVRSISGPENTIIDAYSLGDSAVTANSGEGPNTVLDGFMITNSNSGWYGAIHCNGSSPTLTNLYIMNNSGISEGGGVTFRNSYSRLTNSIIAGNQGRGISVIDVGHVVVANTLISGNVGAWGSAVLVANSELELINVTIAGNRTDMFTPIYITGSDPNYINSMWIRNSIVWGNHTDGFPSSPGYDPSIGEAPPCPHCNSVANRIYIENSDIEHGKSSYYGIYHWEHIYALNSSNTPLLGQLTVYWDDTEYENNMDLNPQFMAPEPWANAPTTLGDYRLFDTSPVLGWADPNLAPKNDFFNDFRPLPDMGAYEFTDFYVKAWWPLDGITSNTTPDIVNGNTATLAPGGTALVDVPGIIHNAVGFNGSTYYTVPDNNSIDFTNNHSFSIAVWVKANTTCASQMCTILDKRVAAGGSYRGYHLDIYPTGGKGVVLFQMANGSVAYNYYNPSSTNIADGNWHFIAIVVSITPDRYLGEGKIYVDGQVVKTFTPIAGDLSNSAPLRIGGHAFYTTSKMRGDLDEIELFDGALTAQEIYAHYNATRF